MISSPITPHISFDNADIDYVLKHKNKVKTVIKKIFSDKNQQAESLNYIFCSDLFVLDINKHFLNHNDFTDIITLNLAPKKAPVLGEIYISIDRVKENARIYKVTMQCEVSRVIFHGALHLCGYKDKTSAEIKTMRTQEDSYLDYLNRLY